MTAELLEQALWDAGDETIEEMRHCRQHSEPIAGTVDDDTVRAALESGAICAAKDHAKEHDKAAQIHIARAVQERNGLI
jgi:hypothetical protein